MSRTPDLKHPMGYVMMGDAEAHHRLQRYDLGLPQPFRGELRSDRACQEKVDSDAGDAALVPGIRRRAEEAGAAGCLTSVANRRGYGLGRLGSFNRAGRSTFELASTVAGP